MGRSGKTPNKIYIGYLTREFRKSLVSDSDFYEELREIYYNSPTIDMATALHVYFAKHFNGQSGGETGKKSGVEEAVKT